MITNKDEVNAMRVMFYQTQMRERFSDDVLISTYKLASANLKKELIITLDEFNDLGSTITYAMLEAKLIAIVDHKDLVKHVMKK